MDVMDFFDIVIHPKERMPKELKKTSVNEAAKTYAIIGAIVGFFIGLALALASGLAGAVTGNPLAGLGILSVVIMPIIVAILVVIGSVISSGVLWIVANLLGGKGTFEQNYYLSSRLVWPVLLASVIAGIVSTIPLVGWIIHLIWTFYTIYLSVIMISVANKLSLGRAFFVWLIPVLIVMAIMAIVVGVVVASVIAALIGTKVMY